MTDSQIHGLVDDRGTPVRWKVATLLSVSGLVVTVLLLVAKAGARSERIDALTAEVKDLKVQMAVVARLEANVENLRRQSDAMDLKLDKLLERGRR